MGFQFAGKAVYTAVWVAAVSLFMELLGFSTQKCLTAGGLGTVLLTLAGREVNPPFHLVFLIQTQSLRFIQTPLFTLSSLFKLSLSGS